MEVLKIGISWLCGFQRLIQFSHALPPPPPHPSPQHPFTHPSFPLLAPIPLISSSYPLRFYLVIQLSPIHLFQFSLSSSYLPLYFFPPLSTVSYIPFLSQQQQEGGDALGERSSKGK